MRKNEDIKQLSPEEAEAEKARRRKRARRKKVWRVIDRIFGFILATGIMVGLAGLALEYVLIKGPSPALKEQFVMTMLETRRFGFIPNIYLTEAEMAEMSELRDQNRETNFDASLINIPDEEAVDEQGNPAVQDNKYAEDEDGDGIIFEEIRRGNYVGYMITVLDPKRVFIGMPDGYGGYGCSLDYFCEKYDALGGINGGGFVDKSGGGSGGQPEGLTIIDGVCYNYGYGRSSFVGFDEDGIMHVGYYEHTDLYDLGVKIVNGISFGPILVMNGEAVDNKYITSGLNPRTAIGQRADGAVLMLVIDGRQVHSVGCTYQDLTDIMLDHGAVNACNLDGGSSTSMWYNGDYVNKCSSLGGWSRNLPNAFLFK